MQSSLNSEKQSLLKEHEVTKPEVTIKPTWRHALLLPALFIIFFGANIYTFALNEYTQLRMRQLYGDNNSTAANFSSCHTTNKSDPKYSQYKNVQQHSSQWVLLYNIAENIPTLLIQFILPPYTDFYGRKFLFISSSLSLLVKSAVSSVTIYTDGPLWYIVSVNIVEGLLGSSMAMLSVTFMFVADVFPDVNKRTLGIVTAEASLLFSVVLSSYMTGYFIETLSLGYFNTSLIATTCCGVGFLIVLTLPETLPKSKRSPPKPIVETIKRIGNFYFSNDFKGKRLSYMFLLLSFMFASLGNINRSTIETLFFLGQPFCWGPSKIGVYMMARHAAQGLLGIGSLKLLQMCLSSSNIAILSTISSITSFAIEAFATTSLMIYMVPVTGMFSFLVIPMIRSMMSLMTSADRQGAIFASVAVIEVFSSLLGSLTFTEIYSLTISFMNGFVFLLMLLFSLVNLILLFAYRCTIKYTMAYEEIVSGNGHVYASK